jgi:hypothetical protein
MKDFFGNELQIGDMVALMTPKYRALTDAVVVSFTPLKIRVAYNVTWGKTSIEHIDPRNRGWTELFLADPCMLVKSPNQTPSCPNTTTV